MNNIKLTNYKLIKIVLSWAAYYWFPRITNSNDIIEKWINQIQEWQTKSGPIWTIGRIKDLRLIYTRYISGEPFKVFPGRIGLYANGLPKATPYFNDLLIQNSNQDVSFILTLLSVSRAMTGTKEPDLSTIVNPPKETFDEQTLLEIGNFIPTFFWKMNLPSENLVKWSKDQLRLSNKAGPEGRATLFAWRDMYFLREEDLENIKILSPDLHLYIVKIMAITPGTLVKNAHRFIKATFNRLDYKSEGYNGSKGFMPFETAVSTFLQNNPDKGIMRKLSIINDPEAKARIIAILDFWTQEALKPLHDLQFNLLSKHFNKDRTFTQDPIITDKEENHSYHSCDLSAATDRFPVKLQELLVSKLVNEQYAKAWKSLLVNQGFYVPWKNKTINYSVGQPMGAYSSWSTFALSHHLIVQYAAHLAGVHQTFNKYILLGDDIVIYDDNVAAQYKLIMGKLGVDISPHKTHVSKDTYEFAKRWFRGGSEITGIQIRGLLENIGKYHLLYASVMELYNRNRPALVFISVPDLILNLLKRTGTYSRMRANIRDKLEGLHAMRIYITDGKSERIISHITKIYKDSWYHLPKDENELNEFILRYIYYSASSLIQKGTVQTLNYKNTLFTTYLNKVATALVCPYSINTSPYYRILMGPITQALRNRFKALAESLSKIESGSVKDMIQVISLPDPSVLEQRSSVRIINTEAALAEKFFASIDNHIKERPVPYEENLSATVAWIQYDELNSKLLNSKQYVTYGLGY